MRPTATHTHRAPGFRPAIDLTRLWDPIPGPPVADAGRGPDREPILLVGAGPRACTSARALDRIYPYDVNGFYAALGVDPRADRGTLAAAYVAMDGHSSPRLTEIIKILLDPVRRRIYDRMIPLQRFQTRAMFEAALRIAADEQWRSGVPLSSVSEPENMDFQASNVQESGSENTTSAVPGPRVTVEVVQEQWGYAYYLWGVTYSASAVKDLPLWQEMIVSALDDNEAPIRFGVGRSALGSSPSALQVGDVPVAFLSAGTAPQQNLAKHVARQLRSLVTAKHTLIAPKTPRALSHANQHPGAPT